MQEFIRQTIHYSLHFLFPGIIAWGFYRNKWKIDTIKLLLTNLIDVDHLFSNPIFDPQRCSVNYHLFHTYYAGILYIGLLFFRNTRIFGIGFILHLLTDLEDCLWI